MEYLDLRVLDLILCCQSFWAEEGHVSILGPTSGELDRSAIRLDRIVTSQMTTIPP